MKYELLDSGAGRKLERFGGRKLERFGDYVLDRPCSQAVWRPSLPADVWRKADGFFTREEGNHWTFARRLPESWTCEVGEVTFKISPTDFGHVGVFPEHELGWNWMTRLVDESGRRPSVLNLFAYTGGATMALAKHGCEVCHLDASKKMVDWAHRNMELNHLEEAPIRWIVDDVQKFLFAGGNTTASCWIRRALVAARIRSCSKSTTTCWICWICASASCQTIRCFCSCHVIRPAIRRWC